jgi:cation:H+ antiporter
MTAAGIWIQFLVCAAIIGAAGPTLSRSGDIIADKTGISGNWIGLILLGTVTSLPELVTGISAVTGAAVPDIAVGDVLGSCVFNVAILVIVDSIYRRGSIYERASQGHILSAGFGVVLIGFVGFNLLLSERGLSLAIGHVGIYTPVIVGLYLIAARSVFVYERSHREAFVAGAAERYPNVTLPSAIRRFILAAVLIVAAGAFLPFIGANLAATMGWGETFVGSLFVAGATSLPELVVTIAAVRIGALNLAFANLLGSNLFDMLVLAADDLFYTDGPILADVSPSHAVSAASAVIMTGFVIVSLLYQPRRRIWHSVGWTSLALLGLYLLNGYVLFRNSG